jgi:hypothetical protein
MVEYLLVTWRYIPDYLNSQKHSGEDSKSHIVYACYGKPRLTDIRTLNEVVTAISRATAIFWDVTVSQFIFHPKNHFKVIMDMA